MKDSKAEEFYFTFEYSDNPKLILTTGTDRKVLKSRNGWEISLETYEVNLKIHTHSNVYHELEQLPTVKLNGIKSHKTHIDIDPPIPCMYKP